MLPPRDLRFGDPSLEDDDAYLASARCEVEVLIDWFGLDSSTRLLDVGSGHGRVAIGILDVLGEIDHYRGVDVVERAIDWCRRHIQAHHPTFRFVRLDVMNLRYNPRGRPLDDGFRFPFDDEEFDLISLSGVVPHLFPDELHVYLDEFQRILAPHGKIHLTAFVEENALAVEINPSDYLDRRWHGPLHCVRYDRGFFLSLLAEHDFAVERFEHRGARGGQSRLALTGA